MLRSTAPCSPFPAPLPPNRHDVELLVVELDVGLHDDGPAIGEVVDPAADLEAGVAAGVARGARLGRLRGEGAPIALEVRPDRVFGLDVREVVGAAATKPFGFMAFQAGPGTGGHCIPLDPLYLSWKLRTLEYRARFVELADDVNLSMPRYVVSRVVTALNEERRSLKGAKVLVLGVAYKRDVDDTRESPSLEILRHLEEGGAEIAYADPYVPTVTAHGRELVAVGTDDATLASYDAIVVATDHRAFPWDRIAAVGRVIVDARGAVPRDRVGGTLWPLSGPPVRGAARAASVKPAGAPR